MGVFLYLCRLGAYLGIWVFIGLPLWLFSVLILWIHQLWHSKYGPLALSLLLVLFLVSPLRRRILPHPLAQIFAGHTETYSDFNGYGPYLESFMLRWWFGVTVIILLMLTTLARQWRFYKGYRLVIILVLLLSGAFSGWRYLEGYQAVDTTEENDKRATYERNYRPYTDIPQPSITSVKTQIDLYPEQHTYHITGSYQLENKTDTQIDSIFLQVPEFMNIEKMELQYDHQNYTLISHLNSVVLDSAMPIGAVANLEFTLKYQWHPVNPHRPFNAIVENGAFMRISRYYPQIGYDRSYELSDLDLRKRYDLGDASPLVPLEAIPAKIDDFMDLEMTISTSQNQHAIGIGDLEATWSKDHRQYSRYRANDIPFRFALASASYDMKEVQFRGIKVQVFYHPKHGRNVEHLLDNAEQALRYCIDNYGAYAFDTVKFVEVSSFTEGFAGTAYPATIFITENTVFNTDLEADTKQDVINEIAGHEIAHFWWGTNQLDPDEREGMAVLTETLAMYTEMMLYKERYGVMPMQSRVALHQQLYDAQRGFFEEVPLIKATKSHPHISYSKGAVVMVQLSELLGEARVNLVLRQFLEQFKGQTIKPRASDLVGAILEVTPEADKAKVRQWFEAVEDSELIE